MLKYKNVPHDAIKLMLFPFSLEGATQTWLEKEPPRSIHTWEDLVSKFVNYFFPPSKTTNLKNDITNFQQKFDETFSEAWDHFKDLLRKCPHHGFSKLHQIDTFYNALTQSDQDSLNVATGGNILNPTSRDALTIIENKSKVCTLRNKPVVSKINTTTSSSPSSDITALTDIVRELVLMNKANQQASVKAIEETCVTCGGPHPYYECLATDSNTFNASAATGPTIKLRQSPSGSRSLPSNTVANLRSNVNAITTRSGVAYDGPTILPNSSSLSKEVERKTEATKDKKLSLPDLTPTRMTLELATRSFTYPAGIAEDVIVTAPLSDFSLSLTPFETNDSLLEEFSDELALLDPFPPGKEDNNFDFKAGLREVEYLLNQDPSTESNIEIIEPILEKFIDKPALDYSPPPRDDDDDLFDLKSDNNEWKKLLYGNCYKDIDSKKDKNKDSKMKSLVVEAHIVESNDLLTQLLDSDSTLPEESYESFEIATLSSSPFG
uniref:Reverse transcriptase domain-containing protein n=1 Tax=Tanacetum cinerariifolium TaxID=118510 RepID=A0A6L2LCD2_TANCI|nr:reverse transcriptase domain-containing protein [Tanacetum cinerariifolium]